MTEKRVKLTELPQEISDRLANNLGRQFRRFDMLPLARPAVWGFRQARR